jgi:hypothetical protein
MMQKNSIVIILATLAAGIILQIILIFADCKDTPTKAAVEFAKDYFFLEERMADHLCEELKADEEIDLVKDTITAAGLEAKERGFGLGMVRRSLSHIETKTISQDADALKIRLHAKSRVCINPVFTFVATLFGLGEPREENAVLSVVEEDGLWKVCGNPFEMADV